MNNFVNLAINQFLDHLERGLIPPFAPQGTTINGWGASDHFSREQATSRGMWAIVTKALAISLAARIDGRTCLEIMSGAGWLAKALSEQGVDIIATDNGNDKGLHYRARPVFEIEKLDALDAVKKYPNRRN